MIQERNSVRTSYSIERGSTSDHVVGFTCERCGATAPVDSTTYEDILANGCVVCDSSVTASAFSRRKTV